MQHLDTDRLAALADESPTAAEAAHLASCPVCREEQDAYVALLDLARREGSAHAAGSSAPLSSWEALAPALRDAGLLRSAPAHVTASRAASVVASIAAPVAAPRRASAVPWRRAAASVALLVGGAALGRASATMSPFASERTAAPTQVAAGPAADTGAPPPAPLPAGGISDSIPVHGEPASDAKLASRPAAGTSDFAGISDAMATLSRAQQEYQRAAAFLAEHDTGSVAGTPQILRARLAALDEVMPAVRAALYEAPQDPVLNQYYLTTYDVRESTLRQLGRTLPVGVRLNGY